MLRSPREDATSDGDPQVVLEAIAPKLKDAASGPRQADVQRRSSCGLPPSAPGAIGPKDRRTLARVPALGLSAPRRLRPDRDSPSPLEAG